MSYKNDRKMKLVKDIDKTGAKKPEVTDKQAEEAFKTILTWIGAVSYTHLPSPRDRTRSRMPSSA